VVVAHCSAATTRCSACRDAASAAATASCAMSSCSRVARSRNSSSSSSFVASLTRGRLGWPARGVVSAVRHTAVPVPAPATCM